MTYYYIVKGREDMVAFEYYLGMAYYPSFVTEIDEDNIKDSIVLINENFNTIDDLYWCADINQLNYKENSMKISKDDMLGKLVILSL